MVLMIPMMMNLAQKMMVKNPKKNKERQKLTNQNYPLYLLIPDPKEQKLKISLIYPLNLGRWKPFPCIHQTDLLHLISLLIFIVRPFLHRISPLLTFYPKLDIHPHHPIFLEISSLECHPLLLE